MTTCEEVQKLLEKPELENTKYELKSSQIFEKTFPFLNLNLISLKKFLRCKVLLH